ncbi:hypothetical protein FRB94_010129 [Tulasnella sp. JGI-2019a]|nr:hypothetical protein FRB94_010129 [Tulasnella sp. JGI-2019a]KAG9018383.1 hypothetical protein FRB93_000086 [Tulasnella sp. JGI-2019a]
MVLVLVGANNTLTDVPALQPVNNQFLTLYLTAVFIVAVVAFWFLPGARTLISPLKLYVIGWHELCHLLAAILSGGKVTTVVIDPMVGGCTRVDGGHPTIILSAGYFGSTVLGGLYILSAWHTLGAKIASFFTVVGLLCPLTLVRDKLTFVLTVIWLGLLVAFWFIDHAEPLRWYALFLGIMHCFFAVLDFVDDRLFKKTNDSDCTQYSLLYPKTSPHHWALGWILFEIGVFVAFTLAGLILFKQPDWEIAREAAVMMPT